MGKSSGLGRGFNAMMDIDLKDLEAGGSTSIEEIPIDEIEANPNQPRKEFDPTQLTELCTSIKKIGLITPITVRKIEDRRYQIIAGERRYRATQLAGKNNILAYVCEADENTSAEMALIENIQRTDLNAIEIALSYKNLMEQCNYTQEQLSERVGKNRATVSNYVRLLTLPSQIQMGLKEGKLDNGHARALLSIENPEKQLEVYNQILSQGLSVRKVEEKAKQIKENKEPKKESGNNPQEIPEGYSQLTDKLQKTFNSKISMTRNSKGKGKISINFANDDELEKIMEILDSINK